MPAATSWWGRLEAPDADESTLTDTAPETVTAASPARAIVTMDCPRRGTLLTKGSDPSDARGPATGRRRPIDTSRKARTTRGSKCEPAHAASSWRALSGLTGRR
jgi:hypothetical protein